MRCVLMRNLNDDFLFLGEAAAFSHECDSRVDLRCSFAAFFLQLDRIFLEPRHDRQLRKPFYFRLREVRIL